MTTLYLENGLLKPCTYHGYSTNFGMCLIEVNNKLVEEEISRVVNPWSVKNLQDFEGRSYTARITSLRPEDSSREILETLSRGTYVVLEQTEKTKEVSKTFSDIIKGLAEQAEEIQRQAEFRKYPEHRLTNQELWALL